MVKKVTIEKLAEITHNEFKSVGEKITTLDERITTLDERITTLDEKIIILNEKMDDGFTAMRGEMQQGFRAVLAAVETVEYIKLRMRIDALEERVENIQKR